MWRVIRVAGAGVAGTATLASVATSNGTIRMSTAAEAAHGNVIVETQNDGVVRAEIHKPNYTVDDASSKGPLARLMTLFDHVRIPTAEAQAASKTAYKPPPFAPWDFNWDGREGAGGKGTRRLIFVRHGQYTLTDTDETSILTDIGRQQAAATGRRLAELSNNGAKIDRVVVSTMARAKETADIILEHLPAAPSPEFCDLIREGAVYPPEPPHDTWKPTNENFEQDGARISKGFEKWVHRAEPGEDSTTTTLFVCHGNVIRYFFMRALQLPPSAWLLLGVSHASLTVITVRPKGKVGATNLGDVGHMPKNLITQ